MWTLLSFVLRSAARCAKQTVRPTGFARPAPHHPWGPPSFAVFAGKIYVSRSRMACGPADKLSNCRLIR